MIFSLIHISDLHFQHNHPSLHRLRLLRDDILAVASTRPFYITFSGDLVSAGDQDLYGILLDEFFDPLLNYASAIYLTPGNHDIQQGVASAAQCDAIFRDKSMTYLYQANGNANPNNPFFNFDPLDNYRALADLICPNQEENYFGFVDNNPHFSLASLNSTWLSYRRNPGETDRGHLRIDPPICEDLSKALSSDRFKIFMTHHPLDWIDEDVRQSLENFITANFDLALFGHNHNPAAISGYFNAGSCLFVHSPAVQSDNSLGSNAYSIINVDSAHKRTEIIYRCYSPSRDSFIPGEDLSSGGVKYPTPDDRAHWHHIKTNNSSELLRRLKSNGPIDFSNWYETNFISKSKSRHQLIEPRVARVKADHPEGSHHHSQPICAALSPGVSRQFIIGPQDSGLTSAAFIFSKHVAEHPDSYKAVPIYVNLDKLTINRATLLREATRTSPMPFTHREVEALANDGALLYIFDQIGLPEVEHFRSVIRTMDRYFPKCSTVFFCAADGGLLRAGSAEDEHMVLDPSKDTIFEMVEFDVEEIGELVRSQRPDASAQERQQILARVVSSFKQMNEPVYPSAVSVLVETLKQSPEFRPINRARLIDRYVECLLGRFEWEDVVEGAFNSSDKVTFLAYVAGQFATSGQAVISTSFWKDICLNYSTERLLELPKGLLEEFTQKGILLQQGEWITFRADYLFTYFVAKEMNLNQEVYGLIAAEEAFFRNFRELVFYGELEGVDNARLLNDTFDRVTRLEAEIVERYRQEGVELEDEWRNMLKENAVDDREQRDDAATAALEAEPTEGSMNHALSADLRGVERNRGVLQRVTVKELEARWLVAIRTYFQLVKHSGGLSGSDKIRHLRKAAGSAELFIKSLAAKRESVGNKVVHYHGGVVYVYPLAGVDVEKARKEFKVNAPSTVAGMIVEHMNNAQLAPVYRELLHDESEIVRFLARHLVLEVPGLRNRRAFVDSLEGTDELILQTCSLARLKHKYLGYSVSEEQKEFYGGIIGDLAAKVKLIGVSEREQLRKKRLLADMRSRKRTDKRAEGSV